MMIINWQKSGLLLLGFAMGLAGCDGNVKNEANPSVSATTNGSSVDSNHPGGCGNDPSYTIEGKQYQVLKSAVGYSEQGTASWYGAEYQGTETAGCEVFDMYAYSAAHRTLPLPSFVRVTNQQTGKNIIVRINDRGPFDTGDLIQLSFAAANALGIKSRTGAPVKVEAVSPDQFKQAQSSLPQPIVVPKVSGQAKATAEVDKSKLYYVIAGTWPDQTAALDMFVRLTSVGLGKTEMATAQENGKMVHQVRIGPLYTQDQIDNVKDTLESNGLANFRVVAR